MQSQTQPIRETSRGPSGPALAALALLVIGHIAAFASWYDNVGSLAGIFAMPIGIWAGLLYGVRGALLGTAWVVVSNFALTGLLKPPDQSVVDAFFCANNLAGHPVMLVVGVIVGRQQELTARLREQLSLLQQTEGKLREAERRETHERMNDRLHQADRMASVGTLAAGVAHEINNPLTYVIGNLYYALERIGEPDAHMEQELREELRELLHDAADGSERVRRIVRDLKTFSRSSDADEENRISVKRAIQAAINLVRNEIRHRAALEVEIHDMPMIAGNESRLVQVLVNLLMNASQAIPEGNAEAEFIRVRATLSGNGRVVIEVSDSGSGMPSDVRARVFDPFFTTKPVGEGTGLGLSVTHGIVASMGGDIAVTSEPGQGSTFTLTLPVEAPTRRSQSLPPPPPEPAPTASWRRPRALVVDDEPKVASSVARSLDDYDVVTVTDGREALDRLRADRAFDVVLCDLMMPHLTGMELFERVRAIDPDLAPRFVFMTGGAFTPKARAFISDVDNVCLEKPFDRLELRRALESLRGLPPRQEDAEEEEIAFDTAR